MTQRARFEQHMIVHVPRADYLDRASRGMPANCEQRRSRLTRHQSSRPGTRVGGA
jgi:hypothetical protein